MKNLQVLDLHGLHQGYEYRTIRTGGLHGSVPLNWAFGMTSLMTMNLSSNYLNGSWPAGMCGLVNEHRQLRASQPLFMCLTATRRS